MMRHVIATLPTHQSPIMLNFKNLNNFLLICTLFLVCVALCFKGNGCTVRGGNSVKRYFVTPLKWVYSKMRMISLLWRKFSHFRVDPFSKEAWCPGKQTRNRRLSPLLQVAENLPSVLSLMKTVFFVFFFSKLNTL